MELGVELIQLTSHGVTPTPAGATFAARARVAQHERDRPREEVIARRGDATAHPDAHMADEIRPEALGRPR